MNEKIISIFSGIGVLDLGFKDNFDLVLAVEIEKSAAKTLEINKEKYHPNLTVWNRDIYSITDEEIAEWQGVSGLVGGPQCQAFSPGQHGFDPMDKRISGLTEYLRWVRIIQPEFFVFENTFGLLQGKKKAFFEYFKEEAEKLGYVINSDILNAHQYGNVQDRKRLIAVGVRKMADWNFTFPKPVPEHEKKYVRDILRDELLGECLSYSEKRREIITHVPEGGHWRQLPTDELKILALGEKNFYHPEGGMTGAYRRLHRDKPCPTLVTNPCQRNTMITHPFEDRPLSVSEYKRAMGIPDDFELVGTVANKYKAIGNAVPRELAQAISTAIIESKKQITPIITEELLNWEQLELPL